ATARGAGRELASGLERPLRRAAARAARVERARREAAERAVGGLGAGLDVAGRPGGQIGDGSGVAAERGRDLGDRAEDRVCAGGAGGDLALGLRLAAEAALADRGGAGRLLNRERDRAGPLLAVDIDSQIERVLARRDAAGDERRVGEGGRP